MKYFIRIIVWTLMALFIQHGIFLYFEYFYLDPDVEITATKVEDKKQEDEKADPNEVQLKSGTKDIDVSMSGRYISYMDEEQLKIHDTQMDTDQIFNCETKGQIEKYKWLNTEDIILVIQKVEEDGTYYFEPVSYDIAKDEARELVDFHYNKMRIEVNNDDEKVEEIAFSTSTHSLYIKIGKGNGLCDLYYSNVMNVVTKVRSNKQIGNIVVPVTNTDAVMEMDTNVTILNSPDNIIIDGVENAVLLGSDMDDNMYIGNDVDGQITEIYFKNLDDRESLWNTYYLDTPVEKENISVSYNGKVYIADYVNKAVTELSTGNIYDFKGKFIKPYDGGFVTLFNNKVIKNVI